MPELTIKTQDGTDAGVHVLEEQMLEFERGEHAVHQAVVTYLANQRQGTAAVKNRSKVRGGGAKPYRQKGTGHARAGSIRSPLWRGGGVIFGPVPRDYRKKMTKKAKILALRRAFTERLQSQDVTLVDALNIEQPKTKAIVAILNRLELGDNVLIIDAEPSIQLRLAARNIPKVDVVSAQDLNVYQLLLRRKVLITQRGLEELGARLTSKVTQQ